MGRQEIQTGVLEEVKRELAAMEKESIHKN